MAGDLPVLEITLKRLYAGIPWQDLRNNRIAEYEGYYASVLYAFFPASTCTVIPEDTTNHGQADMTLRLEDSVYVMEIKVVPGTLPKDAENPALKQIMDRNYAEKYLGDTGVRVFEVGTVFSQRERNRIRFDFREH